MSEDEALGLLASAHAEDDPEIAHMLEDGIMLAALREFGWDRFVAAWKAVETRWYA